MRFVGVCVLVLVLLVCSTVFVSASTSVTPVPFSGFGLASVGAQAEMNGGTLNIQVSTSSDGPFYVEKLLLMLQTPSQSDIDLESVSVDGVYTYSFSAYGATRAVVVPAGLTLGDVVTVLPSPLSFLLTKDPLGNSAVFASGGPDGLSFGIAYSTPLVGGAVTILALILAPTTTTITLTTS